MFPRQACTEFVRKLRAAAIIAGRLFLTDAIYHVYFYIGLNSKCERASERSAKLWILVDVVVLVVYSLSLGEG